MNLLTHVFTNAVRHKIIQGLLIKLLVSFAEENILVCKSRPNKHQSQNEQHLDISRLKMYFTVLYPSKWNIQDYNTFCLDWKNFSMTQLLSHTIANFTGSSFMLKANYQPYKKSYVLVFSWVNVVKNCKILTFKVNFLFFHWTISI